MKITELNADIARLREEREKAHLEMVQAITERDKVLSEVSAQRSALKEVSSQKTILDQVRFLLVSQIENLKRLSMEGRETFTTVYDKQSKYLSSLLEKIERNEEEVYTFVSKQEEIEVMDEKILEKKNELLELQSKITKDEKESDKLKKAQQKLGEELVLRDQELKDKETELQNLHKALKEKEIDLDTREKRLDKLREELLSKN